MKKEYLECGKIVSAHGVSGSIKVECWCDSVKVLASQKRIFTFSGEKYTEHEIINASPSGDIVIMKISGIQTREDAQGQRGRILYLHRDDIPVRQGDMLLADMIGLPVVDFDTGRHYGEISDVFDAARGKVYVITADDGKEVLFPSNREFVKEIDAERGMLIRTIPGFFD